MRILVTGGAGFIGSNLVRYLLQRGVQVRVLDNLTIGKERIAGLDLDLIEGDIRDPQCVSMALDKCDGVVHLAAQSGVQQSLEDPVKDCQINIIGLLTVLEECRKLQNIRLSEGKNRNFRFVMASSNASLGRHEPPVDEKSTPLPLSPMDNFEGTLPTLEAPPPSYVIPEIIATCAIPKAPIIAAKATFHGAPGTGGKL